jgi:hypothetical protein
MDERTEREAWWIKNNVCVNKVIPGRARPEYLREYHNKNRNEISIRKREHREKNRERNQEYREKNRDARNARCRELYALKKSKSES